MKHIQEITEKQYIRAWLKLLTEVAQTHRKVDTDFFDTADERNMTAGEISDITCTEQ